MKKFLLFFLSLFLIQFSFSQTQLITDGGFESSATWYSPFNFQYGPAPNPHTGLGYAYLADFQGYPANNISGLISQAIFIPTGTTDVDISFYYKITTQETTNTAVNDYGYAYLENVNNSANQILLFNYSNLDASSSYQYFSTNVSNIIAGEWWYVKFYGQTNASLPTVFRIDDVDVYANSNQSSGCITWVGGISPSTNIDTSMELLCLNNIISNLQVASTLNNFISKKEIAVCLGKALFNSNSNSIGFLDNFPNVFPEFENITNTDEKRYLKMMLYLEYKDTQIPSQGTDNISPYPRNYFYSNFDLGIKKSDAIKAVLEAFNLQPDMAWYDPTSTGYSPYVCDMLRNTRNLGWVQRANSLGILNNNFTTSCGGNNIYFGADDNITYAQFYLMLAKAIYQMPTSITYGDDFVVPQQFDFKSTGVPTSLEKGVINHYSDNSFSIPAGSFNLEFSHSYHSNLTDFPLLKFNTDFENNHLLTKLEPLGAGWTHNYNIFIRYFEQNGPSPERAIIYWPDGSIHSYLFGQQKYETKGIHDKLYVNSVFPGGEPAQITILKGRLEYVFSNIDPSSNLLAITKIRNPYGDELQLTYQNGTGPTSSMLVKVLSKVEDTYTGRKLEFSYWPNSNYLKEVKDQLNRKIKFYQNFYAHELDSMVDANGYTTKYHVDEFNGTYAYRTHLLQTIQLPKGNVVTNSYFKRKAAKIDQTNTVINISSTPNYYTPWTTQSSEVKVTQNNQTIRFNYQFDVIGNVFTFSSSTDSISRTYDTTTGFILSENNLFKGLKTTYSYDINGYENKKVITDSVYGDSIKYTMVNNSYGEPTQVIDYNDPTSSNPTTTNIYRDLSGYIYRIATNEGTPDSVVHQFTQNLHGQLYRYISPSNNQTRFNYNSTGDMYWKEIVPAVNSSAPILNEYYTYDITGRILSYVNAQGEKINNTYDNNDNITNQVEDSSGLHLNTQQYYDPNDNNTLTISPKGNGTAKYYDFQNDELIRVYDGVNSMRYTYNLDNSIDSFITKNSYAFKFQYFDTINYPGTHFKGMLRTDGITQINYHANTRNFKWAVNAFGKKIEYLYDNPIANYYKRGKFDKPETIKTNGFITCSDKIYYLYNRALLPQSIHALGFMNGQAGYTYSYDHATKKIDSINLFSNNYRVIDNDYFRDGRISRRILGNGDTVFYHYDDYARLDSIWAVNKYNTLLYTEGATSDSVGRHTREKISIYFAGIADTSLPQLMNGNVNNNTYNSRNRLTNANGASVFSDNNGNTATYGSSLMFNYDEYNQVIFFNDSSGSYNYEYDGLGNRRGKNGSYYIVDAANTGNVLMETDINCNPNNFYVWGDDGLVARIDPTSTGPQIFYYHYDFRGSVICITDSGGQIVKLYKYDDFGNIYKEAGALTWNNPYRYVGKYGVEFDSKNLYYMKSRYYLPKEGRFINEDPIWSTNLFTYAGNDPINRIDPSGRYFETALDIASFLYDLHEYKKEPSISNATYLLLDVATTTLPFVAAGGTVARGAIKGVGIEFSAFKAFTKDYYRYNLQVLSNIKGVGMDAHHIFPQANRFLKQWERVGINIHNPEYLRWWESNSHRGNALQYNQAWDTFFRYNPSASREQIINFGNDLMRNFGF